LRVTDKGAKSWTVLFRAPHGQLRRVTLGKYPALPLAMARDRARDAPIKNPLLSRGSIWGIRFQLIRGVYAGYGVIAIVSTNKRDNKGLNANVDEATLCFDTPRRENHNPKVGGSNPSPATIIDARQLVFHFLQILYDPPRARSCPVLR
jgi:hypothetical protein